VSWPAEDIDQDDVRRMGVIKRSVLEAPKRMVIFTQSSGFSAFRVEAVGEPGYERRMPNVLSLCIHRFDRPSASTKPPSASTKNRVKRGKTTRLGEIIAGSLSHITKTLHTNGG
jgi:hypothetical protein